MWGGGTCKSVSEVFFMCVEQSGWPRMQGMFCCANGRMDCGNADVDRVARVEAIATHYYGLFATVGALARVGVCFPPADGLLPGGTRRIHGPVGSGWSRYSRSAVDALVSSNREVGVSEAC